jgi:hypothetical protein
LASPNFHLYITMAEPYYQPDPKAQAAYPTPQGYPPAQYAPQPGYGQPEYGAPQYGGYPPQPG